MQYILVGVASWIVIVGFADTSTALSQRRFRDEHQPYYNERKNLEINNDKMMKPSVGLSSNAPKEETFTTRNRRHSGTNTETNVLIPVGNHKTQDRSGLSRKRRYADMGLEIYKDMKTRVERFMNMTPTSMKIEMNRGKRSVSGMTNNTELRQNASSSDKIETTPRDDMSENKRDEKSVNMHDINNGTNYKNDNNGYDTEKHRDVEQENTQNEGEKFYEVKGARFRGNPSRPVGNERNVGGAGVSNGNQNNYDSNTSTHERQGSSRRNLNAETSRGSMGKSNRHHNEERGGRRGEPGGRGGNERREENGREGPRSPNGNRDENIQ